MRGTRRQQRGVVAALVAVALLGVLLMAGLAIDIGHLVLNKSRLQSTVDAAALAAAKVLDETGSEAQATTAARGVFDLNAAQQPELRDVLSGADIVVQYSATLSPFVPGAPDQTAEYVRVIATDFSMWTSFTAAIGFDELTTGATAVSGPSAPIGSPCDLFPVAVCADMTKGPPYWGYAPYPDPGHNLVLLKLASTASGTTFGPGNFQLIRIAGTGASVVRHNMAGGAACVGPDGMADVDPKPGNVIGPVSQGVNTRFGIYAGTMGGEATRYPPDLVTTPSPRMPLDSQDGTTITFEGEPVTDIDDVDYSYVDYLADYKAGRYTNPDNGRAQRRIVTVPICDCTNPVPGSSGVLPVKAFGSFFLLQPVRHGSGSDAYMFAQFLGEGRASGTPGPGPGTGPYKIVLHNDPDSDDS
jgi:Flp pilus assembly protein TadG